MTFNYVLVLTVYKRNYIEKQLEAVMKQTVAPKYLVVFQNGNHINIEYLKEKYNFLHVKNDYNTKYIGRFLYCLNFEVDYCIIMDDDIIPGSNCMNNYLTQCRDLDSIIGGNGRKGFNNKTKRFKKPLEVGIRPTELLVDYVGHLWCIKQEHIRTMASIKPYTFDTGEDMHLCYSNKIIGNVKSYTAKQKTIEDSCDINMNKYSGDEFASYKTTDRELRVSVEKYFIDNYNLKLIESNY